MCTTAAMTMKLAPKKCRPRRTRAERQALHDVADAVVGVVRRRHVVHRQHDAGQQLHDEQEEQDAAGDEPPAGARRQRLVEEVLAAGADAGARVEPVDERRSAAIRAAPSPARPSIRVANLRQRRGRRPGFHGAAASECRRGTGTCSSCASDVPADAAAQMRARGVERRHSVSPVLTRNTGGGRPPDDTRQDGPRGGPRAAGCSGRGPRVCRPSASFPAGVSTRARRSRRRGRRRGRRPIAVMMLVMTPLRNRRRFGLPVTVSTVSI